MVEQLIAIFCDVDDFCKGYEEYCTTHLLMDKDHIVPKTSMALSEIMTITIFFHLSGYRCFKWYYQKYIREQMSAFFPRLLSYNRLSKSCHQYLLRLHYTPSAGVFASLPV